MPLSEPTTKICTASRSGFESVAIRRSISGEESLGVEGKFLDIACYRLDYDKVYHSVVQSVPFTRSCPFDKIKVRGKAGKALKQVLETYNISQNRVATEMGIGRSNLHRWVNEIRDPGAEMVIQLRDALKQINPEAAREFVRLYLGDEEA